MKLHSTSTGGRTKSSPLPRLTFGGEGSGSTQQAVQTCSFGEEEFIRKDGQYYGYQDARKDPAGNADHEQWRSISARRQIEKEKVAEQEQGLLLQMWREGPHQESVPEEAGT